jgi:hypothetical protein
MQDKCVKSLTLLKSLFSIETPEDLIRLRESLSKIETACLACGVCCVNTNPDALYGDENQRIWHAILPVEYERIVASYPFALRFFSFDYGMPRMHIVKQGNIWIRPFLEKIPQANLQKYCRVTS